MTAPQEIAVPVAATLAQITAAWRDGRPRTMAPYLDEHVAMALPAFAGRVEGRQTLIASFEAFGREARMHAYEQGEVRIDGTGSTAVAQYPFEMLYERGGARWRSTGWDVWAFPAGRRMGGRLADDAGRGR